MWFDSTDLDGIRELAMMYGSFSPEVEKELEIYEQSSSQLTERQHILLDAFWQCKRFAGEKSIDFQALDYVSNFCGVEFNLLRYTIIQLEHFYNEQLNKKRKKDAEKNQ